MARHFGKVVVEDRRTWICIRLEFWIDGQRYRVSRIPVVGGGTVMIRSVETATEVLEMIRGDVRHGKSRLQAIAPYLADDAHELLFGTHWEHFLEAKRRQGTHGGDGRHQRQLSRERLRDLEAHRRRGHLEPLLDLPIHFLTAGILEDWRNWLFDAFPHLAPKTIANVVKDVGTCLRWLVRRQDLIVAPSLPITHVPDHQPRIPTPDALERILGAIPWELRGAFLARGYMGLRPSEAWRANVGDYDFEGRTLSVVGKGGRLRVLPADEQVARWIAEQVPSSTFGAEPLFRNPRAFGSEGRWTASASRRVWLRACAAVGARYPENEGLRHAFGTHAVNRGVPLDRAGAYMGHSSPKTTQRYAKLSTVGLVDVLRPKTAHLPPTEPKSQENVE